MDLLQLLQQPDVIDTIGSDATDVDYVRVPATRLADGSYWVVPPRVRSTKDGTVRQVSTSSSSFIVIVIIIVILTQCSYLGVCV